MGDLLSLTAVFLMLFFVGMRVMQEGLFQLSFQKMEHILSTFTNNIYFGVFTGLITTAVLQSSSLVLVLSVGLVSTGLLSFKQTLGIILGANIGTTVTGEIMAFSHYIPEYAFVVIGIILLFINHRVIFGVGAILVGLGSVFVALEGFESLASLLAPMPIIAEGIKYAVHEPLIGVVIGTIVSGIIQSSSATIGITMSFLNEGIIPITPSIGILLGANIGTCVTALIAIIGAKNEAKLVAMAHIWFNVIGVLIFLPFLGSLAALADLLAATSKEQLAHISVLFNIFCTVIFLPFLKPFESFIRKLHA